MAPYFYRSSGGEENNMIRPRRKTPCQRKAKEAPAPNSTRRKPSSREPIAGASRSFSPTRPHRDPSHAPLPSYPTPTGSRSLLLLTAGDSGKSLIRYRTSGAW